MNEKSILLVGCGNMGGAILRGWLNSGIDEEHITVLGNSPEGKARIRTEFGVNVRDSIEDIKEDPDVIMFGVKPQIITKIIKPFSRFSNSSFLSIIAGKTTGFFEEYLGKDKAIIRSMPNLPSTIMQGATGCYANKNVTATQKELADRLLKVVGTVVWANDESHMDIITGISGSGSAYVFYIIESMIEAATELGLDADSAKDLVTQTLIGGAMMARQSDKDVGKLRKEVTSPNGTTQAALEVLMKDGALKDILKNTVKAANDRSKELAG